MNAAANSHDRYLSRAGAMFGALALLSLSGCQYELQSYYGRHEIPALSASVNGTDVLAGMFTEAGHEVYFRRTLVTAHMQAADTVVWFPDDYAAPSAKLCEWFNNWLSEQSGRTLVFVGRDFDAAPLYWNAMTPKVSADQKQAYDARRLAARFARTPPKPEDKQLKCEWFRYDTSPTQIVDIRALGERWARGVDGAKCEIQLRTKLVPARRGQRLLTSGDDQLVSRYALRHWDKSQILLVANGSFLLNLPLVNHEHRKLAGRLIAAVGDPGRVVFLESGPGGPPIDPKYTDNSLWAMFGAWPLNVILLQLAVSGVIFCYARWPIFGRPKQPAAESTSDFALHVAAVGRLLSRTKDREFALARLQNATANPESPRKPPPTPSPAK